MRILMHRVPSSMSVGVIILGILLAPAAGLVAASVATLALVALPTMLEQGYKPEIATGAVAASGTLGIILPPSIMLFFLAEQLHVTMGSLFLGTLVPGLGLALLFMAYFIIRGWLEGRAAAPLAHDFSGRPGALAVYVLRSLALPMALIILVLGSIIAGWATPTEADAVGAAGGIVLMALTRTLTPRRLNDVVKATVRTTAMVFFIIIAATIFTYPFRYLGGDSIIHGLLGATGFSDWGLLAVILLIIFVLGFFIDWIEIVIITLPIFYPVIDALDFAGYVGSAEMAKVWMAILIGLVLQTSFLTPPFGFSLFFVKGAAPPEIRLADIYRGAVPLVAIQLLGVALVAALPALAVGLPIMALE